MPSLKVHYLMEVPDAMTLFMFGTLGVIHPCIETCEFMWNYPALHTPTYNNERGTR